MWILVKVTQVTLVVDGKDELRWVLARASNCVLRLVRLVLMICSCLAVSRIHLHELHGSTLHSIRIHIVHLHVSLHDVHVVRCVQNSMNSLGDGAVRGRGVCVLGGTKSLSTSTRTWVRRSAVYGSGHTQQTLLKLHLETWEGLLRNQGPKIFREVEIVSGVCCPCGLSFCVPDYSPEPPGPGRIIRNMLGWSLLEKTERSGVWVFRGALQGKNLLSFFSLPQLGDWEREGVVPHSVGGPLGFLMLLFMCVWTWPRYRAAHWRAVLATASRSVEGYRTPDEALVC